MQTQNACKMDHCSAFCPSTTVLRYEIILKMKMTNMINSVNASESSRRTAARIIMISVLPVIFASAEYCHSDAPGKHCESSYAVGDLAARAHYDRD